MTHALQTPGSVVLATTIKGQPVQWARARVGGSGDAEGGAARQKSFFTAPDQARYKRLVQDEGRLAMMTAKARRIHSGKPLPLGVPVIFEALVFLAIPPSFSRAEELEARTGVLRPTGKPDLDNWVKLPMDALEGIAYANDSQVVGFGNTGVWYSDKPRLELRVSLALPGLPLDREAVDLALRNLRVLAAAWRLENRNPSSGEVDWISGSGLVDQIRHALGFPLNLPLEIDNDEND